MIEPGQEGVLADASSRGSGSPIKSRQNPHSCPKTESGPIPGLHRPFEASPIPVRGGGLEEAGRPMPMLHPHHLPPHAHLAFPGMLGVDTGRMSPDSPDLPLDVELSPRDGDSPGTDGEGGLHRHRIHRDSEGDGLDKCEYLY